MWSIVNIECLISIINVSTFNLRIKAWSRIKVIPWSLRKSVRWSRTATAIVWFLNSQHKTADHYLAYNRFSAFDSLVLKMGKKLKQVKSNLIFSKLQLKNKNKNIRSIYQECVGLVMSRFKLKLWNVYIGGIYKVLKLTYLAMIY